MLPAGDLERGAIEGQPTGLVRANPDSCRLRQSNEGAGYGRARRYTEHQAEVLAPAEGPATLTFGTRKATAPEAAWINGTAAHALDYDDVSLRGHPSTVLVPAILAEAETLDASGSDMITAYVAAMTSQTPMSA